MQIKLIADKNDTGIRHRYRKCPKIFGSRSPDVYRKKRNLWSEKVL